MVGEAKCQPALRDQSHKPQKINSSAYPARRALSDRQCYQGRDCGGGSRVEGEKKENEKETMLNLLKHGAGLIKSRGVWIRQDTSHTP